MELVETVKMDPEVKQLWVAALRSGEYPQGKSKLRSSKGYCCLGVLCDLAERAGIITSEVVTTYDDGTETYGYTVNDHQEVPYHEVSLLPLKVQDWAGIENCNPNVEVDDEEFSKDHQLRSWAPLSELNDLGYDFDYIADRIEANM